MGTIRINDLPDDALLLLDSAPLIYVLENHPKFAILFRPLFEAHAEGRFRFALTTLAIAEVLTGPLKNRDEALAGRYRATFQSCQIVELTGEIAESAARLRVSLGLRLVDAVQAASALAVNAAALVTHDRDFSRFRSLPVLP